MNVSVAFDTLLNFDVSTYAYPELTVGVNKA